MKNKKLKIKMKNKKLKKKKNSIHHFTIAK